MLAVLCAASGLVAWGGMVSPRLDWITHFAPIGLACCGLAALLWRLDRGERSRLAAGFLAAGTLAWGGLVVPEGLGALFAERNARGPEGLRVVQFNLWASDEGFERKLAWIRRTDPDVIIMQEVAKPAIPLMAALAPAYPYKMTCEIKPAPCPVTILSKRRPVAEGFFSGGGPHQANTAWARFISPGGPYDIVAVHIDRAPPHDRQRAQFATLTKQLGGFDRDTAILAGDLNVTPWSFVLRSFDKSSGLRRRTRAMPTWPAGRFSSHGLWSPLAVMPIDHVYAGRAWRTVRVRRGPRLGSDHYPVVVDLTRG